MKPWILFFSTAVFCRYFFSVWNQVIFFSGEFFFFWNGKTFRRFLLFLLYSVFNFNFNSVFNLQNQVIDWLKKNSGDFFIFYLFFMCSSVNSFFPTAVFCKYFFNVWNQMIFFRWICEFFHDWKPNNNFFMLEIFFFFSEKKYWELFLWRHFFLWLNETGWKEMSEFYFVVPKSP